MKMLRRIQRLKALKLCLVAFPLTVIYLHGKVRLFMSSSGQRDDDTVSVYFTLLDILHL